MIVPGSASPLLTTTDGGYTIAKSLRFRKSASAYLSKTLTTPTNNKIWTYSAWVKSPSGTTQHLIRSASSSEDAIRFANINADNNLQVYFNGTTNGNLVSSAIYRDHAAWYHVVVAVDTTQATASNRVKIYVNGSQITAFATANYPSQNSNTGINSAIAHAIAANPAPSEYADFYLSDVNFIDGQQLTPSSFGETDSLTGVWKPKAYSGTYGTNGFYLKFTDVATTSGSNAGLGKDFSGNGNYWTTNNISVTSGSTYDSMKDVPTLTDTNTANYAVLNPLQSAIAPSNANLQLIATSGWQSSLGTIGVSSGKWYWEIYITNQTIAANGGHIGVAQNSFVPANYPGYNSTSYAYRGVSGEKVNNATFTSYGATYATGDTIAVALDMDAGTLTFYKNNTSQGTAFTGLSGTYLPIIAVNGSPNTFNINFGQRPFTYTPPTGFKALNTYNLPDSTIVAGNEVMDATTYTATGTTQSITNAGGFKPDLVWLKARNIVSANLLFNSTTGVTKYLESNSTNAEANETTNFFNSFNSNGFSQGTGNYLNGTSVVAWQWQAGQGTTSSNTSGSITSTVSVNASAGFSIVTYTGTGANATVGHGLGIAPKLVIVKARNSGTAQDWRVYTEATGNGNTLFLNATDASTASSTSWNSTSPTSSVFSVGTSNAVNQSGTNYVAYCWSEIAGFSKFGSYTGNGSSDGPFLYTGFRPKFYLFKRTDSAGNWFIFDTSRGTYNLNTPLLYANRNDAESANTVVDFLSNGIKIRSAVSADWNASGATYVYAAFAENPFKNALAR